MNRNKIVILDKLCERTHEPICNITLWAVEGLKANRLGDGHHDRLIRELDWATEELGKINHEADHTYDENLTKLEISQCTEALRMCRDSNKQKLDDGVCYDADLMRELIEEDNRLIEKLEKIWRMMK